MPKTNETDQIQAKINALQEQLKALQKTERVIDVNATADEILASATFTVAKGQEIQVVKEAITSLRTLLFVKEKEVKNQAAEAGLEVIKQQGRIAAQKLEEAIAALNELRRVAAPHLKACNDCFGQLALQNHLEQNSGFPVVEIRDKSVVISTRY